jgi:NADP-dependent 3-hydroxy acid dehydrogenase YdfG
LSGRVALVTGAGSGIGRAIALALAEHGTQVWLVGRRAGALAETAAAANGSAAAMRACSADLTEDSELERIRDAIAGESGRLDAVVHSAGTIALGRIDESSVADLDAQYAANLRAPYLLTQILLPLLRESRGDVVFVNSTASLAPKAEVSQFAATQAALRAVADSLRNEVNTEGVRVMSIFPGSTATPRQELIHARRQRTYEPERLMQAEDVAAMVAAALELPRTAEVMEIVMRPFVKPVQHGR